MNHHTRFHWRRTSKGNFSTFARGEWATVFQSRYGGWSYVRSDKFAGEWYVDAREAIAAAETAFCEPSPEQAPECLRFFGLSLDASVDAIKAAYRRWARATHPDHGGNNRAFKEVQRHFEDAMQFMGVAA